MGIPDGWTDDMSVPIRRGGTVSDVVEMVHSAYRNGDDEIELVARLSERFGLSEEDAELARDRVCGGIIRALTADLWNEPDPVKDPLAWHSFHVVWKTLPRRHWWSREKGTGGPWEAWRKERSRRLKAELEL